ncbi:recombinase family protein [Cetobacterium sp.]|uniref:recombinase family protein n=1 Tax=Cetobacterium sp. TaxID=2071632 RepID=UPI003F2F3FF5
MIVGYVRVSAVDQNEERQINSLKEAGAEKIFSEKKSGKDRNRPKLEEMLNFIREGDIVIVSEFSRLARNTKDLLDITEGITKKGADFRSLKESIDTSSPAGKLMLTVIGAIATFEREILLERQREGIAIAKAKGKFKKPEKEMPKDLNEKMLEFEFKKVKVAKYYNVSRPTLDKWLKSKK